MPGQKPVLSPMIIAVVAFFCGLIVGGVAVAVQRAAAIERIQQQFRAELEAVLTEKQDASTAANEAAPKPPKSSDSYGPGRAA